MTEFRIDLYSEPHKALRKEMFELSIASASCNYLNDNEVEELRNKATALFGRLEKHAYSEDTYAHPIIGPNMLTPLAELERGHHAQNHALATLTQLLEDLAASFDKGQRVELGRQWYRALNLFIAEDLQHLAEEETNMPHLWKVCEKAELFAIMVAFSSHEEPGMLPMIIQHSKNQLNSDERTRMFTIIRDRLGERIFAHALACATPHLSSTELDAIR